MDNIKKIAILLALIIIIKIIAFFASSETAYLSISKIKMRRLVQQKKKGAKTAANLKNEIDPLLTLILIGTNFLNSLASALATSLATSLIVGSKLEDSLGVAGGVGIATFIITYFVTTFGAIVPKTIAGVEPEKIACKNANILLILKKIFYPLILLFSFITKIAELISKILWKNTQNEITQEELKTLIDVGEQEGTLEESESKMLNKIFQFTDLTVHNIMKHRSLIQSANINATKDEVLKKFNESGLKMIAVYNENPDQIVGVLHYKSVLLSSKNKLPPSVGFAQSIMKDVLYVPETFTAIEILTKFKKERTEFAVVLDEQGDTVGVITMDDLLRIVFGRMTDEARTNIQPARRIKFITSNEFIVPGDMLLDDVNELLNLHLESEDFTTIGGWLLEQFGSLPNVGDIKIYQGNVFTVQEQSNRRIVNIKIQMRIPK